MSACTSACRACTGRRFEHCKCCHRTFAGNTLGDGHRVLVGTFVIAKPTLKSKASTAQHFESEELVPKGWVIQSVGNIRKRCITDEELAERGWRVVKGVVRGPQMEKGWWVKDDEASEDPEAVLGNESDPEDPVDETSVLDAEAHRMDDDLLLLDELLPVEAEEDSDGVADGREGGLPHPDDLEHAVELLRTANHLDALDELLLDDLIPVTEPVQLELEYGGMELVTPGLVEPTPEPVVEVPKRTVTLDDFLADWDADTGIIRA